MKKKRTASQVGKMSRRKGKSFECWCARYFTQWTGLEWRTTRNSGRTDLRGDIYCLSRPDLPLVVECKHDRRYSVHAMLKPTKAFADMVAAHFHMRDKMDVKLILLIKNETGIWFGGLFGVNWLSYKDGIATQDCGVFIRLQQLYVPFEISGVDFKYDQRMESVGKTCEE